MSEESSNLMELTAHIVAAYVGSNKLEVSEIPALVAGVHASLSGANQPTALVEPPTAKPTAAQIRKSITDDTLVSFEDGKGYRTLKRHLTTLGMTPSDYIAKWGLPSDYPTTAPSYSRQRSEMAKAIGLGSRGRAPIAPVVTPATKPKRAKLSLFKDPKVQS
jgi:predicted transcriptional regulator